ncbi:hypothetical protein [Rhizorhabdus histidinilytica]
MASIIAVDTHPYAAAMQRIANADFRPIAKLSTIPRRARDHDRAGRER